MCEAHARLMPAGYTQDQLRTLATEFIGRADKIDSEDRQRPPSFQ